MKTLGVLLLGLILTISPALGCAACFGKSDSPMAYGMNAGIMTLLAVIVSILSLVASFFVFIVRRASLMDQEADSTSVNTKS